MFQKNILSTENPVYLDLEPSSITEIILFINVILGSHSRRTFVGNACLFSSKYSKYIIFRHKIKLLIHNGTSTSFKCDSDFGPFCEVEW